MRNRILSRKGISLLEILVVGTIIMIFLFLAVGAIAYWGLEKASVDVVGANRAYDAVMDARYAQPELTDTYDDYDVATFCHAADDAVGYGMLATPQDGGERVSLVVCCPAALSSRPCTVRLAE